MISERTARLIKLLPKPLLRGITRIVVDRYISKYANLTVENSERLKNIKMPVIFICNHLSNADGLILQRVLKGFDVTFIAGVKLADNAVTSLGLELVKMIPITPNTADKTAISNTVKILKSGNSICIFPEGTRSRTGALIKGRKGVLLIAKLSKVPIIPLAIEGTERLLPINDKSMGEERFNHADIRVAIGESFYLPEREEYEDRHSYEDRALYFVMRKIAALLPEKYQGEYKE